MQKKGQVIFFVVLGVILLGIYYLIRNSGFAWNEWSQVHAYNDKSKEPFGLSALYKLTEQLYKDQGVVRIEKSIEQEMPLESAATSSYLMISHNMYFTPTERSYIQQWVDMGGTVLISSKDIDWKLLRKVTAADLLKASSMWGEDVATADTTDSLEDASTITTDTSEETDELAQAEDYEAWNAESDSIENAEWLQKNRQWLRFDTMAQFSFVQNIGGQSHRKYSFTCPSQNVATAYYWYGLSAEFLDSNRYVPMEILGNINDSIINFVAIDYGKGQFLFHSSPIAFSNFHLLREDGKAYCKGMLSYLKPGGKLYWDESNKYDDEQFEQGNQARSKNILNTLLKEKSLAYAWYILMFMVVTYLFLGSRRRQRTIPILPQRTNTSLEFVETISDLHFAQRDYNKLCRQKMKHLLSHLRERYGVTIPVANEYGQLAVEAHHIERIAALSEVPKDLIEDIFQKYQNITTFEPIEQTLLDFHFAIEQFMKWKKQ